MGPSTATTTQVIRIVSISTPSAAEATMSSLAMCSIRSKEVCVGIFAATTTATN
jgi:hypothetical protein